MNEFNNIELLGYIASILVVISIMMASVVKLRIINSIGALLFGTYGMLIGSWPVVVMNYFIVAVNVYYLWKHYNKKKEELAV